MNEQNMKTDKAIWLLLAAFVLIGAAEAQPTGIYELDDKLSFNVLDGALLNRTNGQITLIGHFDPKYKGKIGYLQNLATLLESPAPRFSLEWTPKSDAAVKALFRRMDSREEMRKMARQWGQWFDDEGNVTSTGRYFLTALGIRPRGGSWEGMDRFGKIETVFRAAGNNKAANTIAAYGRFQNAVEKESAASAQAATFNLFAAAGKIDDYQRLRQRAANSEITEAQGEDQMFRLIGEAMDDGLGIIGRPSVASYDSARARGIGPENAYDTVMIPEMTRQVKAALAPAMNSLFDHLDEVQVPNEILAPLLKIQPEVVPEFLGLDAHSQLARVLFESDYLGKTLVNKLELRNKIPGYETAFGFERRNPAGRGSSTEASCRIWISVDRLDLVPSSDGDSLVTTGVKMRINMENKSGSGSDCAAAYGNLLTSLYDQLAVEFGVLHELSECAKIAAVARWLKEKEPDLTLPQTGRVAWNAPSKVSGLLFVQWSPKRPRPGAPAVAMEAMGGVSLVIPPPGLQAPRTYVPPGTPVDSSVVDLRTYGCEVAPRLYDERLINRPSVSTPGSPQAIAWVTEMAQGEHIVEGVSFSPKSLNREPRIVPQFSGPYGDYATVLWDQTETQRSGSALREAIERAKSNPEGGSAALHMCLGETYLQTGEAEKAKQEFQEGVRLMPNDVHVLSAQAHELVEQGNLHEAVEVARQLVALYAQNPSVANALQRLSSFPRGGVLPADAGLTSNPSPIARAAVHNALEQLEVIAQVLPNLAPVKEVSAEQARLGFDKEPPGQPHGLSVPPVGPSGPVKSFDPNTAPDSIKSKPEFIKLNTQWKGLVSKQKELNDDLTQIRQQEAKPGADVPVLQVQEVNIKQSLNQNEYDTKVIEKKMLSFMINVKETPTSAPNSNPK